MCRKFESSEAIWAMKQKAVRSDHHGWQLRGEKAPVNFVVINLPYFQGQAILPWLLRDHNLSRNRGLAGHLSRFRQAMDAAKKKLVVSKNRNTQSLITQLHGFFAHVRRTGLSYRVHFAVCTAMECLLDEQTGLFGGQFASASKNGFQYGPWKNYIQANSGSFFKHLEKRGINVSTIPLAETWLERRWPITDSLMVAGQHLLPEIFQAVREEYGEELVWLDVQGTSDEKRVLKHVDKALPGIHLVRLRREIPAPASEICYF